jgi:hypothetical protein
MDVSRIIGRPVGEVIRHRVLHVQFVDPRDGSVRADHPLRARGRGSRREYPPVHLQFDALPDPHEDGDIESEAFDHAGETLHHLPEVGRDRFFPVPAESHPRVDAKLLSMSVGV